MKFYVMKYRVKQKLQYAKDLAIGCVFLVAMVTDAYLADLRGRGLIGRQK